MKLIQLYGSAVSVIYASDRSFRNLDPHGVYDGCSNNPVNHAVQVIGWGTQNGLDYWLIKNSWGEDFGDGGIAKIRRGYCGMASRCAAAGAQPSGYTDYVPEKTGHLAATACDVNELYPDLSGERFVWFMGPDGKRINTYVRCSHGKCLSYDPHDEKNTCMVLCGRPTCTERYL